MAPESTSMMDISKIFSLLQPKDEEEESASLCQELNGSIVSGDDGLLAELLSYDQYRKCINQRSGWGVAVTPLRVAAAQGRLPCLDLLLAHGAEVDALDVKAQTPLFTAVSGKHLGCVVSLLKAGACPNGSPHNNCSPLLIAAQEGERDILRELLEHGAEVDVRSKVPDWASNATSCRGPLYIAAVYGHMDCFKLLLLHGANPDYNCTDAKMLSKIKQPRSVLETCLRHGCGLEYLQLLVEFGANVYLPAVTADKGLQKEGVEFLLGERARPKTLMSQARLSIRKVLHMKNQIGSIDSLEVPQLLKNYLNHMS